MNRYRFRQDVWDYEPPPLPLPPPSNLFSDARITDTWTRVETEELLVKELPAACLAVIAQEVGVTKSESAAVAIDCDGGNTTADARNDSNRDDERRLNEQREAACKDPIVWRAVDESRFVQRFAIPDLAKRRRIYLCRCDQPETFTTHSDWMAHRRNEGHAKSVRSLTEARLMTMVQEKIIPDAVKFITTCWHHPSYQHGGYNAGFAGFAVMQQQQQQQYRPQTGAIAYGPCCLNYESCPEHSRAGEKCPSWTMVVEAFSNLTFGPRYRLRMGEYLFGSHGTDSKALRAIACKSLDPERRASRHPFYGEYSGIFCDISLGYAAKGGHASDRMFIFCEWSGDHVRDNGIVAPHLDGHGNQVAGERVVMNPLDTVEGRPPMRFMLPILLAVFQPAQNVYFGFQHQMQNFPGASAANRERRIAAELAMLRSFACEDNIFVAPRCDHGPAEQVAYYQKIIDSQWQQQQLYYEQMMDRGGGGRAGPGGAVNVAPPPPPICPRALSDLIDFIITPTEGPLAGAEILGSCRLDVSYPFTPPQVYFMTETGRFPVFVNVCVGVSEWTPATTLSALLNSILSVLTCEAAMATDGEEVLDVAVVDVETVKRLARGSRRRNEALGEFGLAKLRRAFEQAKQDSRGEKARRDAETLDAERRRAELAEEREHAKMIKLEKEECERQERLKPSPEKVKVKRETENADDDDETAVFEVHPRVRVKHETGTSPTRHHVDQREVIVMGNGEVVREDSDGALVID